MTHPPGVGRPWGTLINQALSNIMAALAASIAYPSCD